MTGYVYRGKKPDLGLGDFETVNAAILKARPPGAVTVSPGGTQRHGPPAQNPECGTTAGYHAHYRDSTPMCQPCRDAYNERRRKRKRERAA